MERHSLTKRGRYGKGPGEEEGDKEFREELEAEARFHFSQGEKKYPWDGPFGLPPGGLWILPAKEPD